MVLRRISRGARSENGALWSLRASSLPAGLPALRPFPPLTSPPRPHGPAPTPPGQGPQEPPKNTRGPAPTPQGQPSECPGMGAPLRATRSRRRAAALDPCSGGRGAGAPDSAPSPALSGRGPRGYALREPPEGPGSAAFKGPGGGGAGLRPVPKVTAARHQPGGRDLGGACAGRVVPTRIRGAGTRGACAGRRDPAGSGARRDPRSRRNWVAVQGRVVCGRGRRRSCRPAEGTLTLPGLLLPRQRAAQLAQESLLLLHFGAPQRG